MTVRGVATVLRQQLQGHAHRLLGPAPTLQGHAHNTRLQHNRNLWKSVRKDFGTYSSIARPGAVTDGGAIPEWLATPEYWRTSKPFPSPLETEVKTPAQVEGMRLAATLARQVMDVIGRHVQVGITTDELDRIAHAAMLERKSYPSPLNYRGYPKSICTSVNNVACHGIPDDRLLETGDIISVDVTVYHGGFHGDCCETWCLEGTDARGRELVECALLARDRAIAACGPGEQMSTIGRICEETTNSAGLTIVPVFIGHGIGSYFHGPPDVYHFTNNWVGTMRPGTSFTVEPIVSQGKEQVVILDDGWTAMMVDGGRAAQFEHTVLITDHGHDILTSYNT